MIEPIKFYWFYLEPYSFIFQGENETVIYNTLNGAYIICPLKNTKVKSLIEELIESNDYCVKILESEINDQEFFDFIKRIRASFSGDYLCLPIFASKPFVFKPIVRLLDPLSNYKITKNEDFLGNNILQYLNEVTIYLNTKCDENCTGCSSYYKQFNYCIKNSQYNDFSFEQCLSILNSINRSSVSVVNFSGGNLLKYKYLDELLKALVAFPFQKIFLLNYKHIDENTLNAVNKILRYNYSVTILMHESNSNGLKIINNTNVEYVHIVDSTKSLRRVVDIMELNPELKMSIKPFFNKNMSFFKENIFINHDDITESITTKKSIYRRQLVNELFFGKIFIMPNGDVFSNFNFKSIGNILNKNYSLSRIIFNEITKGKSWLKIRNEKPCLSCCNKYLCPSPSNYEIVMNKMNLCNIKQ